MNTRPARTYRVRYNQVRCSPDLSRCRFGVPTEIQRRSGAKARALRGDSPSGEWQWRPAAVVCLPQPATTRDADHTRVQRVWPGRTLRAGNRHGKRVRFIVRNSSESKIMDRGRFELCGLTVAGAFQQLEFNRLHDIVKHNCHA